MSWAVPILGCLLVAFVFVGAFIETNRHEKRVDAVLGQLLVLGWRSSRELVAFSRGALTRKDVAPVLAQLEREGLIVGREAWEIGHFSSRKLRRCRHYSLTARGRADALRRAAEPSKATAQ